MEITEVRIKLMEDSDDRLQAFCSITFDDCFVVRDLKIIEGANGPFVAMPSRKLTFHCPDCGAKNHLRSGYCNHCGFRFKEDRLPRDSEGRTKLYADIAHPINSECREMIQDVVITEFEKELTKAEMPGYVSRYDDDYGESHGDAASAECNERHERKGWRWFNQRVEIRGGEHGKIKDGSTTAHQSLTKELVLASQESYADRQHCDPRNERQCDPADGL